MPKGSYYLVTRWFGSFLFKGEEIADQRLFPLNTDEIADRLKQIAEGAILDEEQALAKMQKGVLVHEKRLSSIGIYSPDDENFGLLHIDASNFGFERKYLHAATMELGRMQTRESSEEPDRQIAQAVNAMEDLIGNANLLLERLREWYGLYSPEVVEKLSDGEKLALAIVEHGRPDKILEGLGIDPKTALGAEMGDADELAIKQLATSLVNTYESKKILEAHLEESMQKVAPNMSKIVGTGIAARMLAIAGSVERLAMMPASTLQLLGAEKALFRYLKEGGKPPKHGYIYQHRPINTSPWWQRGKISRLIATKLATAAKADAFTKNDIADSLLELIEKGIAEIKKNYPNPPEKKRGKPSNFGKGRGNFGNRSPHYQKGKKPAGGSRPSFKGNQNKRR